MSLQITPVLPDSDNATVEAYVEVMEALRVYEMPAFPPTTRREFDSYRAHPWPWQRSQPYLATADGVPVGRLVLQFPTRDNLKNMSVDLAVLPAYRRRGFGRELLAFAEEQARANGRETVMASSMWTLPELGLTAPDEAAPAFARAMGYRDTLPEVNRVLDLAKVDEDVLQEILDHARAKADGYQLVQWIGQTPEELIDDIAYLDGRLLQDAPMGDTAWEPFEVDADRIRRTEAVMAARGRQLYNSVMVHEKSDRVVAWTTLSLEADHQWHSWQQITIVDPDHRGHRLGALVKVENLRYLRQHEPQVTTVDTFNAHENGYMISINEQMGFRPQYSFQNWRRDLLGNPAE
ncbi:GNAT family N-acetyltransferase [Hamadaea tsunoensis]|uniref:GNAT family N-acetyltransferase n=1 Tax=Hamadaea tsunoensis TaxID=53368 RepID=UPI000489C0C4|nr:GNAT family N-acetyltransferase [Hamadaea tsunoensis]